MDSEPRFVPWPLDPWNEIIPGLFQGGQLATRGINHTHPNVVRVTDEFDTVVSLFWRDEEGNGPDPDVNHLHHFIPDGELKDSADILKVRDFAWSVALRVRHGEKVLVRCQAGYNRSGLVVALALRHLGYTPDDAIAQIHAKRSIYALHNEHFVNYIKEWEL